MQSVRVLGKMQKGRQRHIPASVSLFFLFPSHALGRGKARLQHTGQVRIRTRIRTEVEEGICMVWY